jgi:prepilin-type N-terminal cleavage/methylation domain-containing protein
MRKPNKNKGVTLVELLITTTIISVIFMASTKAFFQYFKSNVRTNQRAVKIALATGRLEEWKSVKGENFLPGVNFPIYSPNTDTSTGVISFSRQVVAIPAVTQLDIDCIFNTYTANSGYSYTLIGVGTYFGDPGFGSTSNCWYAPGSRTVANENDPGNIKFAITCPAGVTAILELTLIDYATKARTERVVVNGITKESYTAANLVPPDGILCSIPLSTIDTATGSITVEVEQTGVINNAAVTVLYDCTSTSGWTSNTGTQSVKNTPHTPTPYTEEGTKKSFRCVSASAGTTTVSYYRNINTSTRQIGDYARLWVDVDTDDTVWFSMPGGNSNVVVGPTAGWVQLTRIMDINDIGASKLFSINYLQNTGAHNATIFANQVTTEAATTATNPNAVLSHITLKTLAGFTDPDSTSGSPVTTASHSGYIIKSELEPTDILSGKALGWKVKVTVSKVNDEYEPVVISNTINR